VIEQADVSRVLALVDFETDAGPDLFVYVVPRAAEGNDVDGATRLGTLKGNIGNQQYALLTVRLHRRDPVLSDIVRQPQ